jgi:hypothetical protein
MFANLIPGMWTRFSKILKLLASQTEKRFSIDPFSS